MTPNSNNPRKERLSESSTDGPSASNAPADALSMDTLQAPPDATAPWTIDFFAMSPGVLVDESFLSRGIGIQVSTIRNWRSAGTGPRPTRLGGLVRYRVSDITAWIDACAEEPPARAGA